MHKKCFLPLWRFSQKIPTLSEWTDVDTSYFYCTDTPHLRLVWILLSICTPLGHRPRQDQSVLSPGGCEGAHRRLRSIQPWMHRRRDTRSWIWLAPARYERQKEGQKVPSSPLAESLPLNARKAVDIDEQLSLHHEKGFHQGILPCSDSLALQGPSAPRASAPEQHLPEPFPEQGASTSALAFPPGSEAAQNELAYALYYARGKTLQKQNWKLPSQLALGTTQKVCRENLQGSFSSSHKTNFTNNEPLVQKILLKLSQKVPI